MKAKHRRIESEPSPEIGVEPLTDCAEVSEHVEVRASTGADTPLARRGRPRTNGRQVLILTFIRDFVSRNPYPPTVREIAKGCQISSTSVVDYNLSVLEAEGHLTRIPHVSRGIVLADRGQLAFGRRRAS